MKKFYGYEGNSENVEVTRINGDQVGFNLTELVEGKVYKTQWIALSISEASKLAQYLNNIIAEINKKD